MKNRKIRSKVAGYQDRDFIRHMAKMLGCEEFMEPLFKENDKMGLRDMKEVYDYVKASDRSFIDHSVLKSYQNELKRARKKKS